MNDCYVWRGYTNKAGYGQKRIRGKHMYVHRLAWAWANGPIPDGMCICHHCDNPPCVNPDHLFLGTQADNMADMVAKGRQKRGGRHKIGIGEAHYSAKLIEGDVFRIRDMLRAKATQESIAKLFGVNRSLISQIKRNEIWKHI